MVKVEGMVVSIEPGIAWIMRYKQSCTHCSVHYCCRALSFSQLFCKHDLAFKVLDPIGVQVGEKVNIAIEEKSLLVSAIIGYGLPTIALITGALFGRLLGSETVSIIGGVVSFLLSIKGLKIFSGNCLASTVIDRVPNPVK